MKIKNKLAKQCTNKNNIMLSKLFTITVEFFGIKQRVREQNTGTCRKSCKSNTLENLMHEVLPLCDLRL